MPGCRAFLSQVSIHSIKATVVKAETCSSEVIPTWDNHRLRMPKVKTKSSFTRSRERRWKDKAAAKDSRSTGGSEVLVNQTRASVSSEVWTIYFQ